MFALPGGFTPTLYLRVLIGTKFRMFQYRWNFAICVLVLLSVLVPVNGQNGAAYASCVQGYVLAHSTCYQHAIRTASNSLRVTYI